MKKFYMTMVALLCGVAAMAENTLYASDIKVETGATAADLVVCLKNDVPIVAYSFRLQLPAGVKAKAQKYITLNEDRIDMDWVRIYSDDEDAAALDGAYNILIQNTTDGNKSYSVYPSESHALLGEDGPVMTIPMTLTDVADGSYDIVLYEISIGNSDGVSVADAGEFTLKLNVGATGIATINADDVNAPIYNVAGQRVSKAQKGVYIQNGKKVAVK